MKVLTPSESDLQIYDLSHVDYTNLAGSSYAIIRITQINSCPTDSYFIRKKNLRKIFKTQFHDHSIFLPTGSGFATPMDTGP